MIHDAARVWENAAIQRKHEAPTPVIVIAGPTASGKSALALALAEVFDGTVINADSMQVYRELRVLTARPGLADTRRAPHRLYGVMSAHQACNAARWRAMALAAIERERRKGRLPILVGGTGLYLRALMEGIAPVPEIPEAVRARARARHQELGGEAFRAELVARDPSMAKLPAGDTQRLVRAYEVIEATGRSLSLFRRVPPARSANRFATILIQPPRETLVQTIAARCRRMVAEGAIEEVRSLLAMGLAVDRPALKALGVREIAQFLAGAIDETAMLAAFAIATRQYAKRQATWFRHQLEAEVIISAQLSESLHENMFSFVRKVIDRAESPG